MSEFSWAITINSLSAAASRPSRDRCDGFCDVALGKELPRPIALRFLEKWQWIHFQDKILLMECLRQLIILIRCAYGQHDRLRSPAAAFAPVSDAENVDWGQVGLTTDASCVSEIPQFFEGWRIVRRV